MDYLNLILPETYSYGCKITNQFNTTITISKTGIESRLRNWLNYLKKYDITFNVKTTEDIKFLRDFFNTTFGSYYGFKFFDFSDGFINFNDLTIKNKTGRNYFRLYRKIDLNGEYERKIDSWQTNNISIDDFADDSKKLIKSIDENTGKIYIAPTLTVNKTDFSISSEISNQLIFNENIFHQIKNVLKKQRWLYIKTFTEEILEFQILEIDDENLNVTILDIENKLKNISIKNIQIYDLNKINLSFRKGLNKELKFYHIVRFEDDNFTFQIDDFNINQTSLSLVELKLED